MAFQSRPERTGPSRRLKVLAGGGAVVAAAAGATIAPLAIGFARCRALHGSHKRVMTP